MLFLRARRLFLPTFDVTPAIIALCECDHCGATMDFYFFLITLGFGALSWGLLALCDWLMRGTTTNERN